MKYRLKDRELQAKLDELTNGEFSASLKGNIEPTDYYRRFNVDGIGVISVMLNSSCLEERFDYDPHGWNSWPGVEPPEDVLMRLEIDFGNGKAFRTAYFAETIYDGLKAWFECDGIGAFKGDEGISYEDQMLVDLYEFDDNDQPFISETVKSVRFRPWEE